MLKDDTCFDLGALRRSDHPIGFRNTDCHRLLTQHMLARF